MKKVQFMIKVKLHTILGIKEIIGKREIEVDVSENSSLSDLMTTIVGKWGRELSDYLYEQESDKIKNYIRFMVNGQDISFLDGMDTKLKDGDEVMIFPPVSGG